MYVLISDELINIYQGYDRSSFSIPKSHIKLIKEISKVNKNIVVVLQGGSPFDLSWQDSAQGVLLTYLSGQAGGSATVNLLWGQANPCGKLAETWPIKLQDCPSYKYFPGKVKAVEYRESIYIGYRYYNTTNIDVYYPFGYGLSYTKFKYSGLKIVNNKNGSFDVKINVTNTGIYSGKEIVELYISKKDSKIFRAASELKAFSKVALKPGQSKTVTLKLDKQAFRYYNTEAEKFAYESGKYEILIGKSSRDIVLKGEVKIDGDNLDTLLLSKYSRLSDYNNPSVPFKADKKQFETLLGHSAASGELDKKGEYNLSSCLEDFRSTFVGRAVIKAISKSPASVMEDNADEGMKNNATSMVMTMPLRNAFMSGKINKKQVQGFVDIGNGHAIKGLMKIIKKN